MISSVSDIFDSCVLHKLFIPLIEAKALFRDVGITFKCFKIIYIGRRTEGCEKGLTVASLPIRYLGMPLTSKAGYNISMHSCGRALQPKLIKRKLLGLIFAILKKNEDWVYVS
ncbi:Uncharacterized protein Rs2_38648 [Raphanus sativus]|uniref:Uncharacterized protein LOC108822775 n=1 Tax=Raphanus sativus TaxID=3726 RepID=A0A9W3CC79_RAPSA|nr:uncharacterized protein LOC108822775 [Raphanus sativus]KAJ4881593.1 Uncharacterized protein Rs2_38648 [Raphanus sativus]